MLIVFNYFILCANVFVCYVCSWHQEKQKLQQQALIMANAGVSTSHKIISASDQISSLQHDIQHKDEIIIELQGLTKSLENELDKYVMLLPLYI